VGAVQDPGHGAGDHELFPVPLGDGLSKEIVTEEHDLPERVGVVQHLDISRHVNVPLRPSLVLALEVGDEIVDGLHVGGAAFPLLST